MKLQAAGKKFSIVYTSYSHWIYHIEEHSMNIAETIGAAL
jgi:hypothetical protein